MVRTAYPTGLEQKFSNFFQADFAFRRGTEVIARFNVNQLFRLAAAKIFCSPPVCMLVESSGGIVSDTGVERVVGTEDNIDGPIYGSIHNQQVR